MNKGGRIKKIKAKAVIHGKGVSVIYYESQIKRYNIRRNTTTL